MAMSPFEGPKFLGDCRLFDCVPDDTGLGVPIQEAERDVLVDPYDYTGVIAQVAPVTEAAFEAMRYGVEVHVKKINRWYLAYVKGEIPTLMPEVRLGLMMLSMYQQREEDVTREEFVAETLERHEVIHLPRLASGLEFQSERIDLATTETDKVVTAVESIVEQSDTGAYTVAKMLACHPSEVADPMHMLTQHYLVVGAEFESTDLFLELGQRIAEGELDYHIACDILYTNRRKADGTTQLKGVDREIANMIELTKSFDDNWGEADAIELLARPESSAKWYREARELLDDTRSKLLDDLRTRYLTRRKWAYAEGLVAVDATDEDLARHFRAHPEYLKSNQLDVMSKVDYIEHSRKRRRRGRNQRKTGKIAVDEAKKPEVESEIKRTMRYMAPDGTLYDEGSPQFQKMLENYGDDTVAAAVVEYLRTTPRSKSTGRIEGVNTMEGQSKKLHDTGDSSVKRYPVMRLRPNQCTRFPVPTSPKMRASMLTKGDDAVYLMFICNKRDVVANGKRYGMSRFMTWSCQKLINYCIANRCDILID